MDKVILKREIESLVSSYTSDEIIKYLKGRSNDNINTEDVEQLITEIKLEKRTTLGLLLMAIGSFIGFISMLFTVLELIPDWRDFFMFGLTSIAIIIVVAGCYLVFEKN